METKPVATESQSNTPMSPDMESFELDWENVPELSDLQSDFENATDFHTAQISKIDHWLSNLNIQKRAKVKGEKSRSRVAPKLIRKQAEWRYASLSEPFLSTPELFQASPRTWEDTKSANQNGLILNQQINIEIDKNRLIDDYVRSAVDEGTAILRVGWEYREETKIEMVPNFVLIPDPEFGETLTQAAQLRAEDPNVYKTQVPEEVQAALEQSEQDGVPYRPEQQGFREEEVTTILENRPTLQVADYRNCYVDPTCRGDMNKASFFVHSFESCTSELEKDGLYKNLDRIVLSDNDVNSDVRHQEQNIGNNFNFLDDARKKIIVYEYWGFYDIKGDGEVSAIVASWVGNTLIRMEENPYPDKKIPFIMVQYLPVKWSFYGEPDGALLEDNQEIMGAVTRGMIDILGRSANAQTGMAKDMLDATNRRKYERGFDYEYNIGLDPRQGIHMHTYPEIPNSAQFMLQLQNMEAESLTGVKAFSGGLTGNDLGESATAVRGVLDSASKRELGILRRLADGLVQAGRKIAAMNAEFLSEEETVRITNEEYVTVRKEELAGKFDLKLTISTAEEDDSKANQLAFMLQTMGPNGNQEIVQMILGKMFKLRKMPDLAHQIENFKPEPDPLDIEMKQLQLEKLRKEIAKIESETVENYAEAKLDGAKAENTEADTDQKSLAFVEQESGVTQERDLQKQGEQARANQQLEITKSLLNAKDKK